MKKSELRQLIREELKVSQFMKDHDEEMDGEVKFLQEEFAKKIAQYLPLDDDEEINKLLTKLKSQIVQAVKNR